MATKAVPTKKAPAAKPTAKAPAKAAPAKKKGALENKFGKKITKTDLVDLMYEKSQSNEGEVKMTKKDLNAALGYFEDVVAEQMATGASIQMTGFLKIKPSYRGPRTGNNIINNEPLEIPENVVAVASVGNKVKEKMREMPKEVFEAIKNK